ncbi:MAG: phytanoyl-CoA dioxygenase family protein [Flavobacteriales bacterium]|nr:phytanoyl-CoA dioxygenase family protein [Flavobacteriales bacterium]
MTIQQGRIGMEDAALERSLATVGYGVVPFIGDVEMVQLHRLFHAHVHEQAIGIKFDSLTEPTVAVRRALHDGIMRICGHRIAQLMNNYRVVISMYYVKKSDSGSELGLHLDPSMTIEPNDHIGIWVPLIDADGSGGEFCILPSSRHYTHPYHALSIPSPYGQVGDLAKAHMDNLSVRAGHAVVFHNNMLHYSRPNVSGRTRLALVIKMIAVEAPLVTAFGRQTDDGIEIDLIHVPDDYYRTAAFIKSGRPEGQVIAGMNICHRVLTEKDLMALIGD